MNVLTFWLSKSQFAQFVLLQLHLLIHMAIGYLESRYLSEIVWLHASLVWERIKRTFDPATPNMKLIVLMRNLIWLTKIINTMDQHFYALQVNVL